MVTCVSERERERERERELKYSTKTNFETCTRKIFYHVNYPLPIHNHVMCIEKLLDKLMVTKNETSLIKLLPIN